MAGLLVSVRSAIEAAEAVAGGATIIDVKEPSRGPLGRADVEVWRSVRAAVPAHRPVSVALGELAGADGSVGSAEDFEGVAFRKLGLSSVGGDRDWPALWREARAASPPGPGWVAVVYADWEAARSPRPEAVLAEALASRGDGPGCVGLLIDTWEKARPSPLAATAEWLDLVESARAGGLFVALAGSLDREGIARLAPLQPDVFAVRGAACKGPGRLGEVDAGLVAGLVARAAEVS